MAHNEISEPGLHNMHKRIHTHNVRVPTNRWRWEWISIQGHRQIRASRQWIDESSAQYALNQEIELTRHNTIHPRSTCSRLPTRTTQRGWTFYELSQLPQRSHLRSKAWRSCTGWHTPISGIDPEYPGNWNQYQPDWIGHKTRKPTEKPAGLLTTKDDQGQR